MRLNITPVTAGHHWVVALLLCYPAPPGFAQVTGGTIQGSVADISGAVIPKAEITVANLDTATARHISANRSGYYVEPNLQPGRYEVTAASPTFDTEVVRGVILNVGADLTVSIVLRPGSATQNVEVTAAPADLDFQSSALTSTVDARTIRELPLNARDWTQLAQLEPGVDLVRSQPAPAPTSSAARRTSSSATPSWTHVTPSMARSSLPSSGTSSAALVEFPCARIVRFSSATTKACGRALAKPW